MSYTKKRYLTYAFITIFTLAVPFVQINGNHLLLLSFEKLQFHFLGTAFNVGEFYVMPFLLMFFFIGVFALTAILGRFWCGWTCPQTIFRVIYRDLIEGTLLDLRRIKNKQNGIDYSKPINRLKVATGFLMWTVLALAATSNFIWYFVPPEDFFSYMQKPEEHLFLISFILVTAAFLIYDIVFLKEKFCTYVCPYSRIQTVLYDDDTRHVVYDTTRGGEVYQNGDKSIFNVEQWNFNEECTTCEACVKVCPTHIDIRKGLQLECINCLECSDACTSVMGKLGKASLINWGSTNSVLKKLKHSIFTNRNKMYIIALAVSLLLAVVFAAQKEHLMVHINKTTELYSIASDGSVQNHYALLIRNTQDRDYTYDIRLEENSNLNILDFSPFTIKANRMSRKILTLTTRDTSAIDGSSDGIINVKVTFFTQEDPNITLTKIVTFVFPKKR